MSRSHASFYRVWDGLKLSDRWALGIIAVSFLVGLIIVMLKLLVIPDNLLGGPAADRIADGLQAFIINTYALIGTGFIVRCWARLGEAEKAIGELKESIDNQALLTSLSSSLIQAHPIIRNVGLDTLSSQLKSMRPMDRGFAISGTNWAMRGNANFWREIRRFASDRRTRNDTAEIVKVIHSGDPREWFDPEAFASLKEQELFCKMQASDGKNNRIERIIVGTASISEIVAQLKDGHNNRPTVKDILVSAKTPPDQTGTGSVKDATSALGGLVDNSARPDLRAKDYADVIRLMYHHGISVYYAVGENADFGSDFALFETDGRDLVMEWEHTHHVGPVGKCNFYDEASHGFSYKFGAVRDRATDFQKLAKDAGTEPEAVEKAMKQSHEENGEA